MTHMSVEQGAQPPDEDPVLPGKGLEDQEEPFLKELRDFLDQHAPLEALAAPGAERHFGDDGVPAWAAEWQAKLFDNGWLVPGYPPRLGGRNASSRQTLVYLEEMARRNLPRSLHFPGYAIVAPTLLEWGDDHQRELAPRALRGDDVWCIGMSEPNAGSDLASLATRAELVGDRFVVNGQKVWTSYAMWAKYCMCYVRTGTREERHRGISVVLVDMASPGIEVRPIRQMTGRSEFAEVFFTDVEVPAKNLVGELNGGWRLTRSSLSHERGGLWVQWVAGLERSLGDLVAEARGVGRSRDRVVRDELARAVCEVCCLRWTGYRGFERLEATGEAPEHLLMKLATSECARRLADLGTRIAGMRSLAGTDLPGEGSPSAERLAQGHAWQQDLAMSFAATIAGGTSQIQRDIVAERVLGLPRR
jgi:alkylation response protein AidB-like acyl-CoA dehydrogenase